MVKKSMVEELIADGAKLLEALDREGFPVEAMFWIDESEEDRSRLVVASPEVTAQGSTPGYKRIRSVLATLDLAGLELDDIYLAEPDSRRFQSMLSLAQNSPKIIAGPKWIRKADAVVYRWSSASLAGRLDPPISAEDIEKIWKSSPQSWFGKPDLLVAENQGSFSIRIHPKHKPEMVRDLPRVKREFEKAIAAARPVSMLTWIRHT